MILDCKVDFKNNVRSIEVYVKSLGTSTSASTYALTEDEENAILENYSEKIQYKHLTFEGYYKKDSNKIVKATDDSDGDKVTLSLVNKVIDINKDFNASLSIETKTIKDSELGTHLTTKDEVAEAKCWLFYDVIVNAVKDKVVAMKLKETDFEDKEVSRESEEF